jgi:hypothetical protein
LIYMMQMIRQVAGITTSAGLEVELGLPGKGFKAH